MTYAEQLAGVLAAIAEIESTALEVRFSDGRMVRRHDLGPLYAERARLTPLAAHEAVSQPPTTIRFTTSKGL